MNIKIMNQIKFVLFMTLTLLLTISSFASSASAGTNLIANPGFESGSTKPLNWALASSNGNVPIWDTVSHSGTRSIKISIPGTTRINSGYSLSDSIEVEPLKDYALSAWVKSEGAVGGPTARVVQYDTNLKSLSQLNLEFNRGTNGWTQKQLDFKTLSNTAYIKVYANIWSGYGTFWLDDVGISLKSTTSTPLPNIQPSPTPTSTPTPTTITPTPEGEISINADKTLSVDGKKTFPVYMYNICNAHFEYNNLVKPCTPSDNSEFLFSSPEDYTNIEDLGYKNKYEQSGVSYTMNAQSIDQIPQDLIDSPAFFGYYQVDEPAIDKLNSVRASYNKVKLRDTKHPVILNHWRDMTTWAPYADIITWDTYAIRDDNGWNKGYWSRPEAMYAWEHYSWNNFLKETQPNSLSKPVWSVIQSNGIPISDGSGQILVPTPKEVRANAYTAITTDVKGIGFWSYVGWGGTLLSTPEYPLGTAGLYNKPELHAYYRQLGRELVSFNDILVLPTKDYSWEYHNGTMVTFSKNLINTVLWRDRSNFNYILKQSGSIRYLIVVNKDSRPISDVKLTISGLTGAMSAKTLGLETSGSGRAGRGLSVNNGQFTDSFDGYGVHIYKIS